MAAAIGAAMGKPARVKRSLIPLCRNLAVRLVLPPTPALERAAKLR